MTPLAHRIARDMLAFRKDRAFLGEAEAWICQHMLDAHFFDVAEILPLAHELVVHAEGSAKALQDLCFLPAPITWLEFIQSNGSRAAFMVAQIDEREAIVVVVDGNEFRALPIGILYTEELLADEVGGVMFKCLNTFGGDFEQRVLFSVIGLLNLINRPGGLMRREHAPHRGIARDLSKRAMVGRFPLRGWTEITLNVAPGGNQREPKAAGSTGDKCLHFVRSHRRRCYGVWVQIPAHWKGDPALGIKQTRYRVVPQRKAA